MISFVPESLQADIIESINDLHFLKGNIEEIEFSVFQKLEESADEYDCEISENSMVCLSVGEDDFPLISVREFLDMAKCKAHLKINDAQSYAKSCNEVYFLLDVRDYATLELLSNTFPKKDVPITELEKTVILDGVKYKVGLFHGFCIYHLLVEESGNFDKYCPSYSSYDYFIRVHCDGENIKQNVADSLASAYAFELQSSFDIILPFSSGRIDDEFVDYSTESLLGREAQMFPLIYGNGATELLELYNTAKNTFDVDFKILGLTKVIEYIAPTIAQKELIERVTLKLSSPGIFAPTAAFISELGAIYDKHRNTTTKDFELIKLSIVTAVTVDDIWDTLPGFVKGKQVKPVDESDCSALLGKIAEHIYSTRNEIAHAKANYEKRGTECPAREKASFCKMLEIIAIRCIRWFAIQPEEKRVVPHEK